MRTKMMLTLAAAAVAAALLLPAPRAQAVTLPAPSGIGAAAEQVDPVEKARSVYVCRRYWNGYRWVRRCRWVNVRPYYYGPGPYYAPPYYGPYRPYRRYYRRW
ncbi:MAG: hypothetical protein ACK4UO_03495 [Pseudolabrys sp.]